MAMKNSLIEQALANRGTEKRGMENRGASRQPSRQGAPDPGGRGMAGEQDPQFMELVEELKDLYLNDRLPEGFDLQAACQDPAFQELMELYPPEAAVRIYDAEQRAELAEQSAMERVSARMRSRSGLPKSQKSGPAAAPGADYSNMSSEAFRQLLAQMKQSARNGGHPKL